MVLWETFAFAKWQDVHIQSQFFSQAVWPSVRRNRLSDGTQVMTNSFCVINILLPQLLCAQNREANSHLIQTLEKGRQQLDMTVVFGDPRKYKHQLQY